MLQRVLDKWFTLSVAMVQIIPWQTPVSPNSIWPLNDDSISCIHLKKCMVLVLKDPAHLNLINNGYNAEVVHDIEFVDIRWFRWLQCFIRRRRAMHHCDNDSAHLSPGFRKPSFRLDLLLLWYIDKIWIKIAPKRNPKSDHSYKF